MLSFGGKLSQRVAVWVGEAHSVYDAVREALLHKIDARKVDEGMCKTSSTRVLICNTFESSSMGQKRRKRQRCRTDSLRTSNSGSSCPTMCEKCLHEQVFIAKTTFERTLNVAGRNVCSSKCGRKEQFVQ